MDEDHYRLKRLEMALSATRILLKSTRICYENMPKTTLLATLHLTRPTRVNPTNPGQPGKTRSDPFFSRLRKGIQEVKN